MKCVYALFIVTGCLSLISCCRMNNNFDAYINSPIVATSDFLGCLGPQFNHKTFLAYAYPEHKEFRGTFKINYEYQYNSIVKLEPKESSNGFEFLTDYLRIDSAPYNGYSVSKSLTFYFLEILPKDLVKVKIDFNSPTAHLPVDLPLTYNIIATQKLIPYFMTLRTDDLSKVKSVKLIKVKGQDKSVVEIKAKANNLFISESIKEPLTFDQVYLEVILNSKSSEQNPNFENPIQADINHLDNERYSDFKNLPESVVPGQTIIKTTEVNSYDNFFIEFSRNSLEYKGATVYGDNSKIILTEDLLKNRIYVSLNEIVPDSKSYSISLKFIVKNTPKIGEPVLIAKYNLDELKETNGFIVKRSKFFYKVDSKLLLSNNVYFAFNNYFYDFKGSQEITVDYDKIPEDSSSRSDALPSSISLIQVKKIEVDSEKARKSKFVIIQVTANNESRKHSSLTCFEIIITKDLYYQVNEKANIDIPYNLNEGQSLHILNYGVKFDHSFMPRDSHSYTIKGEKSNYEAFASYQESQSSVRYHEWSFTSIKYLVNLQRNNQFVDTKAFRFRGEVSRNEGSLFKLTATTKTSGIIEIRGKEDERSQGLQSIRFLN